MFEFFSLGVLFFCCRSAIANLEKISSTDIKCYWDKNKKEAGDGFHAKPLADLMCAKSKATQDIQDVKP
jgi:hypothetical protein